MGFDLPCGAGRVAAQTSALPHLPFPGLGIKPRPAKRRGCGNYGFASSATGGAKPQFPRHVIHYRSRSSPDPMAKRKEGTSPSLLLVHRGNLNPNRVSSLHGKSARGDGSPLSRLSEADKTAPKVRHQKRDILSDAPFLVPVVGLEPTRCRHQRILSPSRLPFHHTGVSLSSIYHPEGKFKRKRFTHQIRGRTGKKRRSAAASSAERKAEKTRPTRWPRASRSVSARTAIV